MCELRCSSCGTLLLREQHAHLPTPWFATEGIASVLAVYYGWCDKKCPGCNKKEQDVGPLAVGQD